MSSPTPSDGSFERVSAPGLVPDYDRLELGPKRTRYAVCIPVINEGERILRQLGRMQSLVDQIDIVIADGGSTDGSMDPSRLKALGVRALLVKRGPGKLSSQMRMAFHHVLERGYDGCVLMDGNDKDEPTEIERFTEALAAGWDFVQGSRFIAGGKAERNPLHRLVAIRAVHAPAISLASRFRYTDTTNGFRAYSRLFLSDPRVAPLRDVFAGYELHYYLSIRAARLGYRVKEVPVTRTYPASGQIPTKISFVRGNAAVLEALGKACVGAFDP
jgi:dolichol-phosphate mannosyltransferase